MRFTATLFIIVKNYKQGEICNTDGNSEINYGISNLKVAKAKHDVIEAYYVPNMNFDEVENLRQELVKRILKYANK